VSATRPAAVTAAVAGLVVMIAWTLAVKYLVPWCWALAERLAGNPAAPAPVMWDLWPLAHAAVALALWRAARWGWGLALAVALAEIAVVAGKFALFLRAPDWTFWRLLWFTNKVYVLGFFVVLAAWLLGSGGRRWRNEISRAAS